MLNSSFLLKSDFFLGCSHHGLSAATIRLQGEDSTGLKWHTCAEIYYLYGSKISPYRILPPLLSNGEICLSSVMWMSDWGHFQEHRICIRFRRTYCSTLGLIWNNWIFCFSYCHIFLFLFFFIWYGFIYEHKSYIWTTFACRGTLIIPYYVIKRLL